MTDSYCPQPFRKDSTPEGCSVTLPSPKDSVLVRGPGTLNGFSVAQAELKTAISPYVLSFCFN